MMQIKIADTQFAHGTSLGSGDLPLYPKYFQWYRGQDNINDMVVITESMFHKVDEFSEKVKIAWILEPRSINKDSYEFIRNNFYKFDYILSTSHNFIDELQLLIDGLNKINLPAAYEIKYPKVFWYPFGGCWIKPEDRKWCYKKTKKISIIASDKRETEGHKIRHEVITAIKADPDIAPHVDVFGRGYTPVNYKLDALKDYEFSIVIENENTPGWFTEKLIDCYMTGTIPINWGFPTFYFNTQFDFVEELIFLLRKFIKEDVWPGWPNSDVYNTKKESVYKRALQYTCPEDWLYENFFMNQPELKNILIKHNIL